MTNAERTTERVVVLMTHSEKRKLEKLAAAAEVSIGEYARRSIASYDAAAEDEEAAIRQLLGEIAESNRLALLALDEAAAELQATRDHFASRSRAPKRREAARDAVRRGARRAS